MKLVKTLNRGQKAAKFSCVTAMTGLLAGCAFPNLETPLMTASPTSVASGEAPQSTTPIQTTPTLNGVPVKYACEDLMSAERLYEFSPNFFAIPAANNPVITELKLVSDLKGLICRFQGPADAQVVYLGLGRFEDSSRQSVIKLLDETGDETQAFATAKVAPGFFDSSKQFKTISVISGNFLVVVSSPLFAKPSDARDFIQGALAAAS